MAHDPASMPVEPLHDARQLVVVTTAGWDEHQGRLHRLERAGETAVWREVDAFDVSLGRNGSAWGVGLHPQTDQGQGPRKREGDGRSPAGVFALGTAFGYADATASALPYQAMRESDWCMDVPDSPLYNRIVDARVVGQAAVAGSTEPMRLDLHHDGDPRYRLGFVIGHNPEHAPGGGSCIFAHLWRTPGEATAGCTAMADADMEALLAWLDPARAPRFVLLPEAEYRRLAPTWHLPFLGVR
ncbi:L,D-transpeptidase family protein [Pseudoxanthomonas suwonensis]|uniref:ErfK/YbiS/YcfS/YnhG family protein n=1 Tax=Pseudoxanthomonas suwonensis TaxID=314722 RepID=A0A0E3Z3V2_9GAMM|nr:L,D-transpeptidase family protein [Pseudoxanthomonas suwonensis]AKC88344.1 ErfK/YbiS/YcfS/YnhG family protein [Pseudoxanthomonas suwonensis]